MQLRQSLREDQGMTRLFAMATSAAVAALLGGSAYYIWAARSADAFSACRQGQVAGGDIGGPFTLVDPEGRDVTDAEVLTKPALVYFGYTFCPDVCPLDMARNAEAVDILEERGFDVTPVFISIDPKRDTPEIMGEYAQNLHPKLIALTGTEEQVTVASRAYKTFFRVPDTQDDFYVVDHTTLTYLMVPGVGFADFFDRDVTADKLADTAACFLTAAGQAG